MVEYPHTRNKQKAGRRCDLQTTQQQLLIAKPDIRRESRFLPTPPAFYAPVRGVPVGILPCRMVRKKTRMAWLPDDENFFVDMFIRFDRIDERDRHRHTDRQTDRQT